MKISTCAGCILFSFPFLLFRMVNTRQRALKAQYQQENFKLQIKLKNNQPRKKKRTQPKISAKSQEAQRQKWADAARKRREAVRSNPRAYADARKKERARWQQRKADGKVKGIAEMDDRGKRMRRKQNREYARKSRNKKKGLKVSLHCYKIVSYHFALFLFNCNMLISGGTANNP